MQPHVKRLRKEFDSLVRAGEITREDHCNKCGRHKGEVFQMDLHHLISISSLDPDSTFNPNTQENVLTLCNDCHKSWHSCYEKDYEHTFEHWMEHEPIDVVFKKVADYKKQKKAERAKHIAKHKGKPPQISKKKKSKENN